MERDAVDEGRDKDPSATGSDEAQHDVVADARPSEAEEASVQQQDGQLAAGEAGGVEKEAVPFFLDAGVVVSLVLRGDAKGRDVLDGAGPFPRQTPARHGGRVRKTSLYVESRVSGRDMGEGAGVFN